MEGYKMAMGEVLFAYPRRTPIWCRGLKNLCQPILLSLFASDYVTCHLHLGSCSSRSPLAKNLRLHKQCLLNAQARQVKSGCEWLSRTLHQNLLYVFIRFYVWYPPDTLIRVRIDIIFAVANRVLLVTRLGLQINIQQPQAYPENARKRGSTSQPRLASCARRICLYLDTDSSHPLTARITA